MGDLLLTDHLLTGMILQVGMTTNQGMGILITSSVYWIRLLPRKVTAGTEKKSSLNQNKEKSSEPSTSILYGAILDILGFLGCKSDDPRLGQGFFSWSEM